MDENGVPASAKNARSHASTQTDHADPCDLEMKTIARPRAPMATNASFSARVNRYTQTHTMHMVANYFSDGERAERLSIPVDIPEVSQVEQMIPVSSVS